MRKEEFPCFCRHKIANKISYVLNDKGNFYDYSIEGKLDIESYQSGTSNFIKVESNLEPLMKKEIRFLFLGGER